MTYSNKTVCCGDLFVHDIIFRSALSYFPSSENNTAKMTTGSSYKRTYARG